MAVIDHLPNEAMIKSLGGVLDYYIHKGQNCVRSWPRWTLRQRSAKVQEHLREFVAVNAALKAVDPELRQWLTAIYSEYGWTWHDAMLAWAFGHGVIEVLLKMNIPFTHARLLNPATIPNNTPTPLHWDQPPDVDLLTSWSAAFPTRFSPSIAGWYACIFQGILASQGSGIAGIDWNVNGTTAFQTPVTQVIFVGAARLFSCCLLRLHTGDYIEASLFQNSGPPQALTNTDITILQLGTG